MTNASLESSVENNASSSSRTSHDSYHVVGYALVAVAWAIVLAGKLVGDAIVTASGRTPHN